MHFPRKHKIKICPEEKLTHTQQDKDTPSTFSPQPNRLEVYCHSKNPTILVYISSVLLCGYFHGLKGPRQPHQSPIDSDNSRKWLFNETGLQATFNYHPVSGSDLDVQYRWQFRAWSCWTSAPAVVCCSANQLIEWIITLPHSYFPKTAQINCSVPSKASARALYCHKLNNKLLILDISTDLHSNNPAVAITFSHTLTSTNCCYLSFSYT